ncbi:phage tail spike protein [Streptococcus respiraculi]|uniref:phage tail spike protein n=1 Tax=Streptococcus respiraculi TaxID=2021971 RepID=UPI000E751E7C|nr:phage tail spike protein [Streptococcus respiraculi]
MIYLKEGNIPLNLAWDDDIVQEANSTYQLSFKFPVTDEKWSLLTTETFLLADDLHGEQEFFIFDVVKENGYVQIYANQVFTLLNYYTMSSINVDRVVGQMVMNALAGSIVRSHPFSFSSDIMGRHTLNVADKSVMDVLAKDKHSILGQWGGDLVRDKYDVQLLQNGGTENESLFMYKKNLSKYHESKSVKSLRTRIHFRKKLTSQESKKEQVIRVTVDSPLINKYSQIYEATMEVNDESVKDVASLKEYGRRYFASNLCDLVEDSLELEVKGKSDVPVKLFDTVSVYHEQFDTDIRIKISKYHFSPMSKKLKSIGFGKVFQSIGSTLSGMVNDAVSESTSALLSDFDVRLAKEIENANRAFDAKFDKEKEAIEDSIEQAKAKAEQGYAQLADDFDIALTDQRNEAIIERQSLLESIEETRQKLQNIRVGSRNYIRDYSFKAGFDRILKNHGDWRFERITDSRIPGGYAVKATYHGAEKNSGISLGLINLTTSEWLGREVTFSVYVKANRNRKLTNFGHETGGLFGEKDITTEWQRFSKSFVVTLHPSNSSWTGVALYDESEDKFSNGDELYFAVPQLEDGTVATTPKPAPEDNEVSLASVEQRIDSISASVSSLDLDGVLKKSEVLIEDGRVQIGTGKVLDGNAVASLLTVQPEAIRAVTDKIVITSKQYNLVSDEYKNVCRRVTQSGYVMDIPLAINEREFSITGEAMRVSGSGSLQFYCVVFYGDGSRVGTGYTSSLMNTTKAPFSLTSKFTTTSGKSVSGIRFYMNVSSSDVWEVCNLSIMPKIGAELIVDGSITADKLNANSVRAGILTANSITSNMIASEAITGDKLKVDTALINKLTTNDALIRNLTAKSAFITAIQAIDLSASRIKSGVLQARNGAMRIDLDNAGISFKEKATLKFESTGNIFYREKKHPKGHNTIGALMFKDSRGGGVLTALGNTSHQSVEAMRNTQGEGGWTGDFAGVRVIRDDRNTQWDRVDIIADRIIMAHSTNFQDKHNSGFYFYPTAVNGWWNLGRILQLISNKFEQHGWGGIGNIYSLTYKEETNPTQFT